MITTLAEWKEHKNKRGRMLSARYAQALGYFQREDWCVKDCGDTQCWIDPKTDKVVCAVDEFSPHSDDHWQMEKIRSLHISLRRVVELGTPSDVKWEARIPAIGENNSGASAIEEVLEHAILMAVIIREENRREHK